MKWREGDTVGTMVDSCELPTARYMLCCNDHMPHVSFSFSTMGSQFQFLWINLSHTKSYGHTLKAMHWIPHYLDCWWVSQQLHSKRIPKVFTSKNARILWPVKSLPAWFCLGRWHRCMHPLILPHCSCAISSKPGLSIENMTRIASINFKIYLAMLDLYLNQTIYLWRNESTEKVCCPGGKQIWSMWVSWATW